MARALAWLLGRDLPPETHLATRRLFLTLLALVYLAAFLSLWVQVQGLLGSDGIAPAASLLDRVGRYFGAARFFEVPTLLWLWPGDAGLSALCAAGTALSLLLLAGVAPRLCAALLWLLYLSLVTVGDIFLSYQWDALLLETGLLAILLAPGRLSPRAAAAAPVDPIAIWLPRLLLFKLMLLSGAVKLESGDPTWRHFTAMDFHYLTQPLPSPVSWYAYHLPHAYHAFEVGATFAIELGVPWLLFAGRRLRWAGAAAIAGLQLLIGSTGNYGFFNLLTLALCTTWLDDTAVRRLLPRRLRGEAPDPERARRRGWPPARIAFAVLAATLLALSAQRALDRLGLALLRPAPLVALQNLLAPFDSINAYGLFAVMTTERNEIGLEGSQDGKTWRSYRFRYKPWALARRPAFAGLHMPRLDWQLWFAALRGCGGASWFHAFLHRVLEGDPSVLALLAGNPFPDAPPRYLRTPFARYGFSEPGSSDWWTRQPLGLFCPTVHLEGGRLHTGLAQDPGSAGGG